ncbi:MAG: hypothetical protein WEA58_13285 [Balneolaceae bacterium]
MTRIIPAVLLIFFLISSSLYAQSVSGDYLNVTYFNVDRESLPGFLEDVEEWKESNQQLLDDSDRTAWRLYRVPYSSNESIWYNFVAVEIAPNLNALQSSERNNVITLQDEIDQKVKSSFAVHSEIWKTEEDVFGESSSPSRYVNTNFMYAVPETIDEYLELENDIAAPLHQHQTERDRMDGWNLNRLVFPTGTTVAYNFITADHYSNLEQINMGITRRIITRVHPEMDVDEFEDFADSIRERVWSDLWELIEFAE